VTSDRWVGPRRAPVGLARPAETAVTDAQGATTHVA
jgi:hypothetical protein